LALFSLKILTFSALILALSASLSFLDLVCLLCFGNSLFDLLPLGFDLGFPLDLTLSMGISPALELSVLMKLMEFVTLDFIVE